MRICFLSPSVRELCLLMQLMFLLAAEGIKTNRIPKYQNAYSVCFIRKSNNVQICTFEFASERAQEFLSNSKISVDKIIMEVLFHSDKKEGDLQL